MKIASISNKLVLTIVIPVILVLVTLGFINYYDTKSILNQLDSAEQNFIQNEIKSFIELQFVALDIIEEPIQMQMESYSNTLIKKYYTGNDEIEHCNLMQIRDELGMDGKAYDLYIINTNGIVVNTTYNDDLGINFFNFGEVHKKYLKSIFSEGIFDSPKFFFENKTKKYKKYSYQATPDKKYIIEIGLYSNQADRIFDYMIKHLKEIAEQRINLAAVDLFFWLDKPTSLDTKKEFFPEHLSILPDLEAGNTLSLKHENSKIPNTKYTYLYVKNINSKLIKGAIVRLCYDTSYQLDIQKKEKLKFVAVLFALFILVALIAFLIKPLGKVINSISKVAKELAVGNLEVRIPQKLKKRKDELGDLSLAIETLISGLVQTAEFAEQTGKGNFDEKYKLLSDKDVLGKTLMKMQARLTEAKREEIKRIEEAQKNSFISDGLAQFGEILRTYNTNIDELCSKLMQKLTDYLDLPMGALFVVEQVNDEDVFEAKAAVAYNRLRLFQKKIKLGEGLVGRCAYEKLPIFLTEIPEDYLSMRSGLGGINPGNIVLVPLIADDKVYGVIELASLDELEPYKVTFTEQLAQSIASTLASVKTNEQTILLLEQSKIQGEELAANEEEMRQNLEELQATQEEASKRENHLGNILHVVDASVFRIEYDMSGAIMEANPRYLAFLEHESNTLQGQHYAVERQTLGLSPNDLAPLWEKLKQGFPQEIKVEALVKGKKYTLHEYYWPVENRVVKICYVGEFWFVKV